MLNSLKIMAVAPHTLCGADLIERHFHRHAAQRPRFALHDIPIEQRAQRYFDQLGHFARIALEVRALDRRSPPWA